MNKFSYLENSHRRKNILSGEWILVSPHRSKRPWLGQNEELPSENRNEFDKNCYLCPGNKRANGKINPNYKEQYVFVNDFSAMKLEIPNEKINENNLLIAESEKGICKVICFSPKHNLTLANMAHFEIEKVISTWQKEFEQLGNLPDINHVQIFENKGSLMGCSNPHPHGQIWAQENIPNEVSKECKTQKEYSQNNGSCMLCDYLKLEKSKNKRIIYENKNFVILVPFWATWPFETLLIPINHHNNILTLNNYEKKDFADAIKLLTTKYNKLFKCEFPYSAGIHQAPTDGLKNSEWHFHMHFYPPLLRSATVKKFMVGYEMLANPQRDITAEQAADMLKAL